ncbi:Uncharacterised protein [Pseudomonas aeruginosa]|nr:Uncharacterised protein [Pseudomonas aeruginosa]
MTINGETWPGQPPATSSSRAPPTCPRLRVPGCQPVPPPDGAAQPGLRSQAHRRRRAPRRAGTGLRPAGHRALAGTHAGTPLRRRAATRRHRPGPPHQPAPAADGRAAGIPRPEAQGRDPALSRTPARGTGHPGALCQPLAGRSGAPGRFTWCCWRTARSAPQRADRRNPGASRPAAGAGRRRRGGDRGQRSATTTRPTAC